MDHGPWTRGRRPLTLFRPQTRTPGVLMRSGVVGRWRRGPDASHPIDALSLGRAAPIFIDVRDLAGSDDGCANPLDPRQYTMHNTQCTIHARHYTLHAKHYTPHTTHHTLHTAHCTLHTAPSVLDPRRRPKTQDL
eukprot:2448312-Rhodomonas_salina.2